MPEPELIHPRDLPEHQGKDPFASRADGQCRFCGGSGRIRYGKRYTHGDLVVLTTPMARCWCDAGKNGDGPTFKEVFGEWPI